MQKKPYEVHYSVLLWYTWARYVRIVQAQGRTLVVENYSTDVKMFKNIKLQRSRRIDRADAE